MFFTHEFRSPDCLLDTELYKSGGGADSNTKARVKSNLHRWPQKPSLNKMLVSDELPLSDTTRAHGDIKSNKSIFSPKLTIATKSSHHTVYSLIANNHPL